MSQFLFTASDVASRLRVIRSAASKLGQKAAGMDVPLGFVSAEWLGRADDSNGIQVDKAMTPAGFYRLFEGFQVSKKRLRGDRVKGDQMRLSVVFEGCNVTMFYSLTDFPDVTPDESPCLASASC